LQRYSGSRSPSLAQPGLGGAAGRVRGGGTGGRLAGCGCGRMRNAEDKLMSQRHQTDHDHEVWLRCFTAAIAAALPAREAMTRGMVRQDRRRGARSRAAETPRIRLSGIGTQGLSRGGVGGEGPGVCIPRTSRPKRPRGWPPGPWSTRLIRLDLGWWTAGGSNSRPPRCERHLAKVRGERR
jgi:hypothetical protein